MLLQEAVAKVAQKMVKTAIVNSDKKQKWFHKLRVKEKIRENLAIQLNT